MMNKAAIARVLCKMGKSHLSAGETSECLQGMQGLIKVLSSQFASGGKVGSSIKSTERPALKKTDRFTTAGRPVYENPEGELVSEKSITVPIDGSWINVPSIHDGVQHDEDDVIHMLKSGKIQPTSVHPTLEDAIGAAQRRSSGLLSYQSGGFVPTTPPPPTRKFYGTWNGRPVTEEQMKVLEATQAQNEANDPIQQELNDYAREATARAAARRAAATTK